VGGSLSSNATQGDFQACPAELLAELPGIDHGFFDYRVLLVPYAGSTRVCRLLDRANIIAP
jgi:hypothetical protein